VFWFDHGRFPIPPGTGSVQPWGLESLWWLSRIVPLFQTLGTLLSKIRSYRCRKWTHCLRPVADRKECDQVEVTVGSFTMLDVVHRSPCTKTWYQAFVWNWLIWLLGTWAWLSKHLIIRQKSGLDYQTLW
jgi:hypothetical protein